MTLEHPGFGDGDDVWAEWLRSLAASEGVPLELVWCARLKDKGLAVQAAKQWLLSRKPVRYAPRQLPLFRV